MSEDSPSRRRPAVPPPPMKPTTRPSVREDPAGPAPQPAPREASDLLPLVYDDLRRAARARLAALAPGQTLQPTALVHEAYLRLLARNGASYENTRHFFFAAARAMHDILVEHARSKACLKRGGQRGRLDLERLTVAHESPPEEMLALSEALSELEARNARQYQIVLLRFFAGCTAQEAADATGLSLRTANREWAYARAWLHKRLSADGPGGPEASMSLK